MVNVAEQPTKKILSRLRRQLPYNSLVSDFAVPEIDAVLYQQLDLMPWNSMRL